MHRAAALHDYALLGNTRSAALVSREASIDWLCWPRFDAPSLFGALLDPDGGTWSISPAVPHRATRRYVGDSNVHEVTFSALDGGGELRVTDFMPVEDEETKARETWPEHELVRIVRCARGDVDVVVRFEPRPGYGKSRFRLERRGQLGIFVEEGVRAYALRSEIPFDVDGRCAIARTRLRAGESIAFTLTLASAYPAVLPPLGARERELEARSIAWWQRWASRIAYDGPHRAAVTRSALALKLLTYAPSGAVVAAPTTSLPERPGGDLNWDYRYCWLRDASFTSNVLFQLGYHEEADAFVSWLLHVTRLTRPKLRVLYDVYGNRPVPEHELAHWRGHGGACPVRIGNGAIEQLQLDVYGEVIDAAAQHVRRGARLDRETQSLLRGLGKYVCETWRKPDEGIWEPRSGPAPRTHSLLLCWVALDRLLELCKRGNVLHADVDRYEAERANIRALIETRAYTPAMGSYSARLDAHEMDATLLLLPRYQFEDARSARMQRTYERVVETLRAGRDLLYRYKNGDSPGEGAFAMCSFWEIDFLARAGRQAEARALFERLLGYANDVGLFAEEIEPRTGAPLGNFPLALTHIGVINAAQSIARGAVDARRPESTSRPFEGVHV